MAPNTIAFAASVIFASLSTLNKGRAPESKKPIRKRTMAGDFPPNSRTQGLRYLAASVAIILPTRSLPVNCKDTLDYWQFQMSTQLESLTLMWRTAGCAMISAVRAGAFPLDNKIKFKTPAGNPASSNNSTTRA